MKQIVTLLLISLLTSPWVLAETSVWRAEKEGSVIYLGGTFHFLRQSDLPLPVEFDKAYKLSDILVFETDIGQLDSLAGQHMILSKLMYTDGSTVEQHIKPETYQVLADYCAEIGVPIAGLKIFKPSMIAISLTVMEFMKMGMTQNGVDQIFYNLAVIDKKSIDTFETLEQQIGFLVAMGEGNEDDFILHTIRDIKNTTAFIEQSIKAWKQGSADELNDIINAELQKSPELYKSLIVDRNLNWMPKIRTFQKTPEIEYILVGAAHLVGQDGIIKMLEDEGYSISKL